MVNHAILPLLMVLLLSGCASAKHKQSKGVARLSNEAVLGLFDVSTNDMAEIKAAGFTHVMGRPSIEYLDAASKHGLHVLAFPQYSAPPSLIRKQSQHPALWAWYLFDEPDLHVVPPQEIRQKHELIRRYSKKSTLTMFASGLAIEKYRHVSDLIAFDWYPIPWAPLATLNRELRLARMGSKGKPFYATLQVFDWSAFPELLRTDADLRAPTADELKCMSYLSLLHGSDGLLFYTYKSSTKWVLRNNPELWTALTNVVADVGRDFPIFQKQIPWWPVHIEYDGEPKEMFNEIYDSRMAVGMFEMVEGKGPHGAGFYFVMINTSAQPSSFSFKFPFAVDYLVSTSDGEEVLSVNQDGWMKDEFQPFQVKVIGPVMPETRPSWLMQTKRQSHTSFTTPQ